VWVPGARRAAGWIPGQNLRDARARAVLVIASRDDADSDRRSRHWPRPVDSEIVVSQQAPSLQLFEPLTVALSDRGVPTSPSRPMGPCTAR